MIHVPPQSPPADLRVIRVFRVNTINNQSSVISHQEIVLILADGDTIQQTLVEIARQKVHVFIALLVHEIEQSCFDRLSVVGDRLLHDRDISR